MITFEELIKKLKREQGVTYVCLVGSILTTKSPNDIDLVVNALGRNELEILDKYHEVVVNYKGRPLPIDLHLQSTDSPIQEVLKPYETYRQM